LPITSASAATTSSVYDFTPFASIFVAISCFSSAQALREASAGTQSTSNRVTIIISVRFTRSSGSGMPDHSGTCNVRRNHVRVMTRSGPNTGSVRPDSGSAASATSQTALAWTYGISPNNTVASTRRISIDGLNPGNLQFTQHGAARWLTPCNDRKGTSE